MLIAYIKKKRGKKCNREICLFNIDTRDFSYDFTLRLMSSMVKCFGNIQIVYRHWRSRTQDNIECERETTTKKMCAVIGPVQFQCEWRFILLTFLRSLWLAWGQKSVFQPHKLGFHKMFVCSRPRLIRANLSIGFGAFGDHS